MDPVVLWWWWKRRRNQSRKRRIWVRQIYLSRPQDGEFYTLFNIIREDEEKFLTYARMPVAAFDELLSLVKEVIQHPTTNFRETISPAERLISTLRFLATGGSYHTVGYSFRISPTTMGKIVPETCDAIWNALRNQCFPKFTEVMWKEKARRFGELWNFEFCVGSLDGKHIRIQCPSSSGSLSYNYKNFLTLQLVVDADLTLTAIDVGDFGNNSDGSVFKNSNFGQAFLNNELDLPPPGTLGTTGKEAPYCFVADEAYPLKDNLMRPYSARTLDNRKRVFNQRLSHARKTVECAFGLLASTWEIFQGPLRVSIENAEKLVLAACALHNFVRSRDGKKQGSSVYPNETSGVLAAMTNLEKIAHTGRRCDSALEVRDNFAQYFMHEGRVDGISELL